MQWAELWKRPNSHPIQTPCRKVQERRGDKTRLPCKRAAAIGLYYMKVLYRGTSVTMDYSQIHTRFTRHIKIQLRIHKPLLQYLDITRLSQQKNYLTNLPKMHFDYFTQNSFNLDELQGFDGWYYRGTQFLYQLFDSDHLKSFQDLQRKFDIPSWIFFQFLQLCPALLTQAKRAPKHFKIWMKIISSSESQE